MVEWDGVGGAGGGGGSSSSQAYGSSFRMIRQSRQGKPSAPVPGTAAAVAFKRRAETVLVSSANHRNNCLLVRWMREDKVFVECFQPLLHLAGASSGELPKDVPRPRWNGLGGRKGSMEYPGPH